MKKRQVNKARKKCRKKLLVSMPYQKIMEVLEEISLKWLNVGEYWSCKKEILIESPCLRMNEVKEERGGREKQVFEILTAPVAWSQPLEVLGQLYLSPCTRSFWQRGLFSDVQDSVCPCMWVTVCWARSRFRWAWWCLVGPCGSSCVCPWLHPCQGCSALSSGKSRGTSGC